MKIGCLYRMTQEAKQEVEEQVAKHNWLHRDLYVYCPSTEKKGHVNLFYEPIDSLVVPLEIYDHTENGKPLKGKTSRRLKVLFVNGRIGTLFVDITEWEEVNL